jgi:predicted DNA-binding transcriptional regulator AlpA
MSPTTPPLYTLRRIERSPRLQGAREIPTEPHALLSGPDIQYLTGVCRATLYRWVRDGRFPPPDRLLPGDRHAWKRATYDAWLAPAAGSLQ